MSLLLNTGFGSVQLTDMVAREGPNPCDLLVHDDEYSDVVADVAPEARPDSGMDGKTPGPDTLMP